MLVFVVYLIDNHYVSDIKLINLAKYFAVFHFWSWYSFKMVI